MLTGYSQSYFMKATRYRQSFESSGIRDQPVNRAAFEPLAVQPDGSIRKLATRKLGMLDAAATLQDLESPPGNRLEALTRDRVGQPSIRTALAFLCGRRLRTRCAD
jgi:plasmid maintenance system killer protein